MITCMTKLGFPQEAIAYFCECLPKIEQEKLQSAATAYLAGEMKAYNELCTAIVKASSVRLESVEMLCMLTCAKQAKNVFDEKGYDEQTYWETMEDLQYKLKECKDVYDCWGTFVATWFRRFFLAERFQFGRLQYEKAEFEFDYRGSVKKGDLVYYCHIPSKGPLLKEEVMQSIKRAYAFYKAELKDGIMPIACHSWLLYEPLASIFPTDSNTSKFRALFEVVNNEPDANNSDFWRVFNCMYTKETLDKVQPKTGLQKRLKEYLATGKSMGCGVGIFLFDGEKIL